MPRYPGKDNFPEGPGYGQAPGNYITIESQYLRQASRVVQEEIEDPPGVEKLANLSADATVLVVGLGNWHATPDALGPGVIDELMVTARRPVCPEESEGLRIARALAPGKRLTGIETEIVMALCKMSNPI